MYCIQEFIWSATCRFLRQTMSAVGLTSIIRPIRCLAKQSTLMLYIGVDWVTESTVGLVNFLLVSIFYLWHTPICWRGTKMFLEYCLLICISLSRLLYRLVNNQRTGTCCMWDLGRSATSIQDALACIGLSYSSLMRCKANCIETSISATS